MLEQKLDEPPVTTIGENQATQEAEDKNNNCISTEDESKDKSINNTDGFYSISKDYWSKQPPTVNGMLGGYDFVSDDDIQQSQQFLEYFVNVSSS